MSTELQVWIAAALTLMVLSFLYRDNPFSKLAEHIFVGVSAAYWMVVGFWSTLWPNAIVKLIPDAARVVNPEAAVGQRDWLAVVPVLLGLLLLCRLWPRMNWLSRWPTAFAIGATAGYNLVRYIRSDLLHQIEATVRPGLIAVGEGGVDAAATLDQILVLVGTVCGLAYFYYSREHRGFFGRLARVGVFFMMVSFGASFGYTVMGRVSVLVGRFNLLLGDWLGLL